MVLPCHAPGPRGSELARIADGLSPSGGGTLSLLFLLTLTAAGPECVMVRVCRVSGVADTRAFVWSLLLSSAGGAAAWVGDAAPEHLSQPSTAPLHPDLEELFHLSLFPD